MDKTKIMVVEDEAIVAHNIARQLKDMGYEVVAIEYAGESAVEKAKEVQPDLVVMDIVLSSEMDGIDAAEKIKTFKDIPVVYLTAYADEKTLSRAKISGPSGYVLKPVEKRQLHVAIELALHKHMVDRNLKNHHTRIYQSVKSLIEAVAATVELRGPYTTGHHERVAKLATAIAHDMGLTDIQVEGIDLASRIYDIGTVNIPFEILQNVELLEGINLTIYQTYPEAAYGTLTKIECIWPVADITLQHRECFDGSGFPRGIRGDVLLIEARILAVSVALEDLMTHRNYRSAFSLNEALEEISSQSGSKYDPDAVAACLKLFKENGFKMEG